MELESETVSQYVKHIAYVAYKTQQTDRERADGTTIFEKGRKLRTGSTSAYVPQFTVPVD
jgi:hypothetical protein